MIFELNIKPKFLNLKFTSLYAQITILLIVTMVSLLSIFYVVAKNTLKDYRNETIYQFNLVENYIYSSISNAEQVLNGLSFLISKTSLTLNNIDLFEIIKNFDSQPTFFKAIPFSALVVLNNHDLSIASSSESLISFKQKDFSQAKCIENTKQHPFKLHIGSITTGVYSKEIIIPLGITIFKEQKFLGSICTGLSIANLKLQMSAISLYNHFNEINLVNTNDLSSKAQEINQAFSFNNILKYLIFEEELKISKSLQNYPYNIIASIDLDYLAQNLKDKIAVCFCYSLLFLFFVLVLFIITKRFYANPFKLIKDTISNLPEKILFRALGKKDELQEINSRNLTPTALNNTITSLTKHLQTLYENEEKLQFEQHLREIRSKILHLSLIEQHYSPLRKILQPNHDILYQNILISFVNEESQVIALNDYMNQILNYLREYFYDMNIELQLDKSQVEQVFYFKYTALTETIFHIFLFIQRAAISSEEVECPVIIKASFKEKNTFPTITLELAPLQQASQLSLGWEAGAEFPNMSLLSIYLLAKENNLVFSIEQNDSKLIFALKPYIVNESAISIIT